MAKLAFVPLLPLILMAFTHKHILRSNAAPLIYHVFNVEQDQVIRDNKFDIRAGMAREETEIKTKASQSHELSRECSMAPTGSLFSCLYSFIPCHFQLCELFCLR